MKQRDRERVRVGWIVGCRNDHRPFMPRRVTAVYRVGRNGIPDCARDEIVLIRVAGINRDVWMRARSFRVLSKSQSLTQYREHRRSLQQEKRDDESTA